MRLGRPPLWGQEGSTFCCRSFAAAWGVACSKQDPKGSNGNVRGAGGSGVGLAELMRDRWPVQALVLPMLNGRKGPAVLKGLKGEIRQGGNRKWPSRAVAAVSGAKQFPGSGHGQRSSLGLRLLPSTWCASLAPTGRAFAGTAVRPGGYLLCLACGDGGSSWRPFALPGLSEPPEHRGHLAPCLGLGAGALASLAQLAWSPLPGCRHVGRRAALCFLLLLGLELLSPRPGQRESCMHSGPQEDAFASTSSQRLFLKAN